MKAKSAFPNAGQTLTTVGLWMRGGLESASLHSLLCNGNWFCRLRKIPAVGEAMAVAGGRKVILTQSVSKK